MTLDDIFDTVAVVPYNRVPWKTPCSNTRTWGWLPMDPPGDGEPHILSRYFIDKFPYVRQVNILFLAS
jgi:hypothetical protein